ncbi:MAG: ORF6N domain-containing protein [Nitrosomonadales bacterium]|nr:ORF6N domain-containing protein [Nitrosomonadales bacterium]
MTNKALLASVEQIESQIFLIRGQRVMLDADLAELYGVETGALNRAIKRNSERFPEDFMFQLTAEEFADLRCKIGISNLRSQIATSNNSVGNPAGRGGRRHLPYAFTEHGAIMAASVLNSPRAVEASVQVVRAFVQLRQILASNAELSGKLAALEKKYDIKFRAVFEAIRELMTPSDPKKKRPIGFAPWEKK